MLEILKKEWAVIEKAPISVLVFIVTGLFIGSWYYNGQLNERNSQIATRDGEIGRLRVALGIDKGAEGILVELTPSELKAKSAILVSKLRDQYRAFNRAMDKAEGDELRTIPIEFSERFDRQFKSDAVSLDIELRRRLGRAVVDSILGVPRSFYSADTGAPVSMFSLPMGGMGMSAPFMGVLADGIEQMSLQLPDENPKK